MSSMKRTVISFSLVKVTKSMSSSSLKSRIATMFIFTVLIDDLIALLNPANTKFTPSRRVMILNFSGFKVSRLMLIPVNLASSS